MCTQHSLYVPVKFTQENLNYYKSCQFLSVSCLAHFAIFQRLIFFISSISFFLNLIFVAEFYAPWISWSLDGFQHLRYLDFLCYISNSETICGYLQFLRSGLVNQYGPRIYARKLFDRSYLWSLNVRSFGPWIVTRFCILLSVEVELPPSLISDTYCSFFVCPDASPQFDSTGWESSVLG